MLSHRDNDICAYWLHCLTEQVAIRAGKLRIIPGAEARDPDFKQYPISDLHAAQLIFGAIVFHFQAIGKSTGQRFCEMLVQCCDGGLLSASKRFHIQVEIYPARSRIMIKIGDPPPVGICSHCLAKAQNRDASRHLRSRVLQQAPL